ncbi:hypothetical protein RAS1_37060 [Phycisphaerae bacterium RAS1]|nr:hypothetical protein RAS1_37060 [Phycisphaerae bacterium RAS1]
MKLREFGLLTNENIPATVVDWLRESGFNVVTAFDARRVGAEDRAVLQRAAGEHRIVVTHDADCGRLAIAAGEPVCGILYLRPGHIEAAFTIASLEALVNLDPDVAPPFVIVARRAGARVSIRVRAIV